MDEAEGSMEDLMEEVGNLVVEPVNWTVGVEGWEEMDLALEHQFHDSSK